MGQGHAPQEGRDRGTVDVVAAALALRLQDVCLGALGVRGDLARLEARLARVEGVDVRERARQSGERGRGGRGQVAGYYGRGGGRLGRRENLLDLLRPRDLREDRRALDRGRALEMVPRFPGAGVGVVSRAVARAHVDDGHLEGARPQLRRGVQELPARARALVRQARVLQDLGERQAEHGDRGVGG